MDGGPSTLGLESTIVSCLDGAVRLLRPGAIKLSQLRAVVPDIQIGGEKAAPRVPGCSSSS